MIPYTGYNRNCLQCCVAGLLNVPLQRIPHLDEFMSEGDISEGEERWAKPFIRWCHREFGLVPIFTSEEIPYIKHIRCVKSDRGIGHATISQKGMLIWDPSWKPTQAGQKVKDDREYLYSIVFVPETGVI